VLANTDTQARRVRGLTRLLDWLADQPGETWQHRWLASGAEAVGAGWRQVPMSWLHNRGRRSQWLPGELSGAFRMAICADLVRPSLDRLVSVPALKSHLARDIALIGDPDGFARLRARCDGHPVSAAARSHTLQRSSLIVAAKGDMLADITVGDVLELLDAETKTLAAWPCDVPVFYQMLREMGIFGEEAPARPVIDRDEPGAKDALVSALVNDANALLAVFAGVDPGEWGEQAQGALALLALRPGRLGAFCGRCRD
jgi:hypothetical protein